MVRSKLTNRQWKLIEPLLPGKPSDPGRSGRDNRRSLEGMLWIIRTGAPWRDLPLAFGKWGTVYQRFRRWENAGVFERVFKVTRGRLCLSSVQVDGTNVKTHQHAAGAPKEEAHPTTPNACRLSGEAEVG